MSWTDAEREINEISKWAKEQQQANRETISKETNFYVWNDDEIREYGWENLHDLQEKLATNWNKDCELEKLSKICAVAAYKLYRSRTNTLVGNDVKPLNESAENTVPDYIYAF